MSFPLESIDQLHCTVTRITTHSYNDSMDVNSREIKKATGFFYANGNKIFLNTNRHVVIDEKEDKICIAVIAAANVLSFTSYCSFCYLLYSYYCYPTPCIQ
jgi:hypothetical protein